MIDRIVRRAACLCGVVFLATLAIGCSGRDRPAMSAKSKVATAEEIEAARKKLNPGDRALAEEQQWCVVATKQRLGSMGVPVKVTVKGRAVFLCCEHCEKKALADPDKTLASLETNKRRASEERPSPKE